jgi:hypothetical protein
MLAMHPRLIRMIIITIRATPVAVAAGIAA